MECYYLGGTTCAGKDHFAERAAAAYPEIFSLVQVGKEFRRRYPPSHFQGEAAPSHCEAEALEIFEELLADARNSGRPKTLITSQPRRVSQVESTINKYPGPYIWLWAPADELANRAAIREADSSEALDLALQRIRNDRIQMFDLIFTLLRNPRQEIWPVCSSIDRDETPALLARIMGTT